MEPNLTPRTVLLGFTGSVQSHHPASPVTSLAPPEAVQAPGLRAGLPGHILASPPRAWDREQDGWMRRPCPVLGSQWPEHCCCAGPPVTYKPVIPQRVILLFCLEARHPRAPGPAGHTALGQRIVRGSVIKLLSVTEKGAEWSHTPGI